MRLKLTTNQTFIVAIALTLLAFVAIFGLYYKQSQSEKKSAASLASTHDLLFYTERIASIAAEIETNSRAYLLTGQLQFLEAYENTKSQVPAEADSVKQLALDNAFQQQRINTLLDYVTKRIVFCDSVISIKKEISYQEALQLVSAGGGKLYLDNVRQAVSQLQQEEKVLLEQRKKDNAKETVSQHIVLIAIAFVVFTLLIALFWKEKKSIERNEREKVQEALSFLSLQINQAHDAIYVVDADRKIKSWNKGAERLYGYTKDEVLNKNSNEILKTSLTDAEIDSALKQVTEQDYWTGEFERKTKSGNYIFVRSSTTTIRNAEGIITGYVAVSFDITKQKQLTEQVNHLANMVEQSSEAIVSRGMDQRVISWNKGAEKLFGYSKEEAVGKKASDLGFIRFSEKEIPQIEKQIADNAIWHDERYFYNKDGTSFFGSVTGNLINNEKGEITSFVFIVKDISVRRQLEEQLKKYNEELEEKVKERTEEIERSEKKYRYLFENNPMPMWIIDLVDFKFLDVNKMAVLQYGYSREEFLAMTAVDIRPDEEKELFLKLDHTAKVSQNNYNRGVWKHRKKDGSIIIVEIIAHEIFFEGAPAQFILSNDITEKKKIEEKLIASEKQFRRSLDNMLEGVQIIDFDWRYIYVNDSMAKHGKYPKEHLLGHTVMQMYPGIEQTDIYKIYQQCFNERVSIHLENNFIYPDGTSAWFELSFQPVAEGIFILSMDITERKQAEEKIKQINVELEERVVKRTAELRKINEELEAFSYSVSHDLRAPLRAIIGFTTILEEDYSSKLDNEAKRITGIIKNNTQKMGKLIDDLLTFSRMGRQDILKAGINTMEVVTEITQGLDRKDNDGKKIQWLIHALPDVIADINTIRQVWINLISNAIKYSGKSASPQVEIGSFRQNGQIVFFVKDNGVGFDEKYKNKLFKVFQRLHSTEEFEGTGIGLAIIEKIISKHGGSVWAESTLNEGACFYFSLPDTHPQQV